MFIGEIVYFDLEGVSFSHLEKEMENLRSKARYKTVTCNTYTFCFQSSQLHLLVDRLCEQL
jgi:hypothetical protein